MSISTSIILMLLSSVLAALGQLSLKFGSMKLERRINKLLKNYTLLIGVILYGMAALANIIALRGAELTILYPIASLNYVWVSFLSMKFLKENMNIYKWAGVALIVVGVSVIL